jgi:hypothetical protein
MLPGPRRSLLEVCIWVWIEAFPSNIMGNIMFGGLVKPNQGESNQIKPVANICSGSVGVEAGLAARRRKGLGMGHFDASLLDR